MSTIYLPNDYGDAVVISGVAYHKNATNPVCQAADTTLAAGDLINISEYTFERDDDQTKGGAAHRTYTACQMAIWNNNKDELETTTSYQTAFTAPAAGVVRFWMDGSYSRIYIKINGVEWGDYLNNDDDTAYESMPFRVASGDVITAKTDGASGETPTLYWGFIPYVYP